MKLFFMFIGIGLLTPGVLRSQYVFVGFNSGGGTGALTLVQAPGSCGAQTCACTTTTSTCAITVNSAPANGNLSIFSCGAFNLGTFGVNPIASVNVGGTLVKSVATIGTQGSDTNAGISMIYPSTNTGVAGTTVNITLTGTPGNGTGCDYREYHPSANPNNVGLDCDMAIGYLSSGSPVAGPGCTTSSTSPVVVQMFMSQNGFPSPSTPFVSSPYDTLVNHPSFMGFSSALTAGTAPSWTLNASTDGIGTFGVAIGYNPTAGLHQGFNDFEQTSGTVTAAQITSSQHGAVPCTWSIPAGSFTSSASASMPLLNSSGRLYGDGVNYASGQGTLGVRLTGSGSSVSNYMTCNMTGGVPVMSASANFKSSLAANDTSGPDNFYIQGSTAALNFMFHGNGTNRFVQLECNDTSTTSAGTVTITPNTEYTLMLLFDSTHSGVGVGGHKARVYNTSGVLQGSEMSCDSLSTNRATGIAIGNIGAQTITNAATEDFDSPKWDWTGTWPLVQ